VAKYDPKMAAFYRRRAKARLDPEFRPPVRACAGCQRPATSSRHQLCDACREESRQRRNKVWADRGPRLTPKERGYGPEHARTRARWKPEVDAGGVACNICGRLIVQGSPWHLSHPNDDKRLEPAPAHAKCNIQFAAAVTAHRRRRERNT